MLIVHAEILIPCTIWKWINQLVISPIPIPDKLYSMPVLHKWWSLHNLTTFITPSPKLNRILVSIFVCFVPSYQLIFYKSSQLVHNYKTHNQHVFIIFLSDSHFWFADEAAIDLLILASLNWRNLMSHSRHACPDRLPCPCLACRPCPGPIILVSRRRNHQFNSSI